MRAHYLQHVPFEGLGCIEHWLIQNGYVITGTRFFKAEDLPDVHDVDLLIIMGGPMSVNDEAAHPWLVEEKAFIRDAIEAGKPVLGVCLGAQLIVSAVGGEVLPNEVKEIGWFPVQAVRSESADVFQFPERADVFHWHGDTYRLPEGAVQLAKSAACEQQAFQLGRSVIGLQFHLEVTPVAVQEMLQNCGQELTGGPCVQRETEISSAPVELYASVNRLMGEVMTYLRASSER